MPSVSVHGPDLSLLLQMLKSPRTPVRKPAARIAVKLRTLQQLKRQIEDEAEARADVAEVEAGAEAGSEQILDLQVHVLSRSMGRLIVSRKVTNMQKWMTLARRS